jgi:hypothetical protein
MELNEEAFEKLRLSVEQLSSELNKQNTVRVVNTRWMIIVGAVLLSALGFTSFVQVPKEADRAAREHVGEDVKIQALKILTDLKKLHDSTGPLIANLPIGTVIPSMLNPMKFANEVGDPDEFQSERSKWAPADGRSVVGSRYASEVRGEAPDLRGVFIRGLNYTEAGNDISTESEDKRKWADPDDGREAGSLQEDTYKKHRHSVRLIAHWRSFKGDTGKDSPLKDVSVGKKDKDYIAEADFAGNTETRPKNAAVFFYIKIN